MESRLRRVQVLQNAKKRTWPSRAASKDERQHGPRLRAHRTMTWVRGHICYLIDTEASRLRFISSLKWVLRRAVSCILLLGLAPQTRHLGRQASEAGPVLILVPRLLRCAPASHWMIIPGCCPGMAVAMRSALCGWRWPCARRRRSPGSARRSELRAQAEVEPVKVFLYV